MRPPALTGATCGRIQHSLWVESEAIACLGYSRPRYVRRRWKAGQRRLRLTYLIGINEFLTLKALFRSPFVTSPGVPGRLRTSSFFKFIVRVTQQRHIAPVLPSIAHWRLFAISAVLRIGRKDVEDGPTSSSNCHPQPLWGLGPNWTAQGALNLVGTYASIHCSFIPLMA